MLVRCTSVSVTNIQDEAFKSYLQKKIHLEEIGLEVGKTYPVYGLTFWDGCTWFYLCDEERDIYPTPFNSYFFELIDPVISSEWGLLLERESSVVPSLWAAIPNFYERLIDGDREAEEVFARIKEIYGRVR